MRLINDNSDSRLRGVGVVEVAERVWTISSSSDSYNSDSPSSSISSTPPSMLALPVRAATRLLQTPNSSAHIDIRLARIVVPLITYNASPSDHLGITSK